MSINCISTLSQFFDRGGLRRLLTGKSLGWLLLATLLLPGVAAGEKHEGPRDAVVAGESQPIDISADSMVMKTQENKVVFNGDVIARRGEMTVNSQVLDINLAEGGEEIREIIATEKVSIRRGELIATGKKAVFDMVDETVTLTGSPRIWRASGLIAGEKIIMHLRDERVEVEKPTVQIQGDSLGPLDGARGGSRGNGGNGGN